MLRFEEYWWKHNFVPIWTQKILDDQTLYNFIKERPYLVVILTQLDQVSEKLIVYDEFCPKNSGFKWILFILKPIRQNFYVIECQP